ncbi:MAG: hypothetical protein KDJ27_19170 [Gammaproteobacteria bacterium]|nr:hypothetical protein [Gammaproteobacteria bacterium]
MITYDTAWQRLWPLFQQRDTNAVATAVQDIAAGNGTTNPGVIPVAIHAALGTLWQRCHRLCIELTENPARGETA